MTPPPSCTRLVRAYGANPPPLRSGSSVRRSAGGDEARRGGSRATRWRPHLANQWAASPERQCSSPSMLARSGPPPQARSSQKTSEQSGRTEGASARPKVDREKEKLEGQETPGRPDKDKTDKSKKQEKEEDLEPAEPELESLKEGVTTNIAGSSFRIKSALGQGSFGTVWKASSSLFGEVAIKEISCFTKAALADAEFEGHLLRNLGLSDGTEDPEALERIPTLVAQEAQSGDKNTWRVLIAMTKIPGRPLSELLDSRQAPAPTSVSECYQMFSEACGLAGELLTQLVPTFEHVANLAYHRDVTPRNILIDCIEGRPVFGLIDFGLAVDSAHWHLGVSAVSPAAQSSSTAGWRQIAVAGDGRYWPVSSWFAFGHGKGELARRPGLCHEYKTCLDIHSLGLTALQVVAEMSPILPEDSAALAAVQNDPLLSRLWRLRAAWETYWKDATHFWLSIYQTFQTGGDFEALKAAYVKAKVHETICKDLCALHDAVCDAREACDRASNDVGLACAKVVMEALLLMISTGEKSVSGSSWRSILVLLSGGSRSRRRRERERENQETAGGLETGDDNVLTAQSHERRRSTRDAKSPSPAAMSPTSTAAPGSNGSSVSTRVSF